MTTLGLSNSRAATPILDSLHKTIEFTVFERDFIDSGYFQRLHFILQNSTAYTSFPSNKNTRFPHSLGVAKIAGDLFSKSLSNATHEDLDALFEKMAEFLLELCERVRKLERVRTRERGRFPTSATSDDASFDYHNHAHKQTISGRSGFIHNPLADTGISLDDYERPKKDVTRIDTTKLYKDKFTASFLADTYWQAIRMYGLMHDLGHLPMSHAFEAALSHHQADLFKLATDVAEDDEERERVRIAKENFDELIAERRANYWGYSKVDRGESLEIFAQLLGVDSHKIADSVFTKALHEVRGISIFNRYLFDFHLDFTADINSYGDLINFLCLAIIFSGALDRKYLGQEKPHRYSFLLTLKKLIDGEVDADRLDYTLRDAIESGIDLGAFDLQALVSNAIIIRNLPGKTLRPTERTGSAPEENGGESEFAVGYYFRARSAIEQFYEQRYQSYKYIIYHRTCSRSNKCLEYLLAMIVNYAFLFPDSPIADLLEEFGYIRRDFPITKITKTLPDETDQEVLQIDDSNLRTLLFRVQTRINADETIFLRGEKKFPKSPRSEHMIAEINNLCEVVLLRKLENVLTVRKFKTARDVIEGMLGKSFDANTDKTKFAHFLQTMLSDPGFYSGRLRENFIKGGLETTYSIIEDVVRPKIFNSRQNAAVAFEDKIWLVFPNGRHEEIYKSSPSLRDMNKRENEDTHLRLYVVAKGLKGDAKKCQSVTERIGKFVQTEWKQR
ncbi:hypothetical protein [Neorhizobium sp. T6_25]|uniref:hypothetical protein n=1 Tax=Neorhizobium sp. T6_25 TaxID=2093833 RepID=UPI000CF87AB0|nr:hypothetical protein [Neorhizobium sp. T6_25]